MAVKKKNLLDISVWADNSTFQWMWEVSFPQLWFAG